MDQADDLQQSAQNVSAPAADNLTQDPAPDTEVELDENGDPITPAEEEDELDIDGRKLVVPKSIAEKLKAERMMQADYTRKTQEVAEHRRAVEAQREQLENAVKFQTQFLKEAAQLQNIEAQLQEFQKITPADWAAYTIKDPTGAINLERQMRDLQASHAQLTQSVTQKHQQQNFEAQQSFAKQVETSGAYLERALPNAETRVKEVMDYATRELGVKHDDIRKAIVGNPALAVALHKAELFDRLQKTAPAKAAQASTPPVTRVTAKAGAAQKDPDKMTSDEWLRWRNAQVSKKR